MEDNVNSLEDGVRAAAFRALLATGRPVSAADLALLLRTSDAEVQAALEQLDRRGKVRRNGEGRVVGSCGLSVAPTRHELQTGAQRFWTWCAYDAVGILGALGADGTVQSTSAATGRPLQVTFLRGSPETDTVVIVMPDASCCDNVVEEWCPQVNFVEDEETARSWLRSTGQVAEVVPIAEASWRGAAAWATVIDMGSDSMTPRIDKGAAVERVPTVQELADAIAAATLDVNEQDRSIVVSLYELLAQGDPVTPAALAARSSVPEAVVLATLESWPGVFRDDEGRVVGFWGLAIPEMAHRFHAEGGKPIYAWCALDPFLIVPVIGRQARVDSTDPITGEHIRMTVTPGGIQDVSPASAVMSFLMPDRTRNFDQDVILNFCSYVLNFASRESAERWASEREGIAVLPVHDAFEVALRAWSKLRGEDSRDG